MSAHMIDGGTEAFTGKVTYTRPGYGACYKCGTGGVVGVAAAASVAADDDGDDDDDSTRLMMMLEMAFAAVVVVVVFGGGGGGCHPSSAVTFFQLFSGRFQRKG